MANLAIRGHETRGKEVIEILEMLGGKNEYQVTAIRENRVYFVDEYKNINFLKINQLLPEHFIVFTLEEFLEKYPYKVGDKVQDLKSDEVFTIDYMFWDEKDCTVYYLNPYIIQFYTVENLKLYKEIKEMSNNITLTHSDKEGEKNSLLASLIEYFRTTPKDELEREWNEHNELDKIGPTVEEYIAFVESIKKQSKYPKTYEECCKIVGANPYIRLMYDLSDGRNYPYDIENLQHYENIRRLLICRTAYWKIAGEQMGLGKTWKPDYKNPDVNLYVIINIYNKVEKAKYGYGFQQCILTFPTEEMRDTFYENFKELIEACKEIL